MRLSDYRDLMYVFSRPRPTGSEGEHATARAIRAWLEARHIPYRVHTFPLYPYFFESIGLWIILSRTVLAAMAFCAPGPEALLVALVGLLGGSLDILIGRPVVTWIGRRRGENILIEFAPSHAEREVVLTAHYDSKTELLDHRQRAIFVEHTRLWAGLTLLVGLLAAVEGYSRLPESIATLVHVATLATTSVMLLAAWGLGLHLSMGRVVRPSQGAVDNGAACAVLLKLAERIAREGLPCEGVRVTIALFTGEEANMQGSRAYVRSRPWPHRTRVVNLELLGQDGPYVLWEQDGDAFHRVDTSPEVRAWVANTVEAMTGQRPRQERLINSDGFSFLRNGLAAATLGTLSTQWGIRGLHRPSDNLERVNLARLPEHEDLLWALLTRA